MASRNGIAIYYPMKSIWYDPVYSNDYLTFAADGLWDGFLQTFYNNYTPTCHDPNEPNDDMPSATGISYRERAPRTDLLVGE